MSDSDHDVIERTAGEWFTRREFGLTPAEESELAAWLSADPRHALVMGELEQTSRLINDLAVGSRPARRPLVRWVLSAGLAAAVALVAFLVWRPARNEPDFTLAANTANFGYRVLDLPDGSVVRLNAGTWANVRYTATERRVQLSSGEAIFDVAKDRQRPFHVDSGRISIRAVGTSFNVRLQPDTIEVLVTEGRVTVEDSTRGTSLLPSDVMGGTLGPGKRITVRWAPEQPPRVGWVETVPEKQQAEALAWQEKRLAFGAVPLAQVVEEFNRYHSHQLVIADPELAKQEFGGTFRADGTETLLSLLERNFDVAVDRQETTTVLRRRER